MECRGWDAMAWDEIGRWEKIRVAWNENVERDGMGWGWSRCWGRSESRGMREDAGRRIRAAEDERGCWEKGRRGWDEKQRLRRSKLRGMRGNAGEGWGDDGTRKDAGEGRSGVA